LHRARRRQCTSTSTRFGKAGYAHATKNEGQVPRVVIVEFANPQGKTEKVGIPSHYRNPRSATARVDERDRICTTKVCFEDMVLATGAVTTKFGHTSDQMLVAVSDYELADQIEGKGAVVRTRESGQVEYFAAGITHRLTNKG
jgi:hypothetical protein